MVYYAFRRPPGKKFIQREDYLNRVPPQVVTLLIFDIINVSVDARPDLALVPETVTIIFE